MKLNGDLSVEDVTMLASEITEYPWEAVCMFATELQVKTYLVEPKKRNIWLVLGMLMEWDGQRSKGDESPKKVLAGILMKLEEKYKQEKKHEVSADERKPGFKKLARKLDIQALATDQMEKIQQQYIRRQSRQRSLANAN